MILLACTLSVAVVVECQAVQCSVCVWKKVRKEQERAKFGVEGGGGVREIRGEREREREGRHNSVVSCCFGLN